MSSLISIIIPIYNHAHTIQRCFKSIIAQIYRPLEVIIVDDESTDEFRKLVPAIESIAKKHQLSLKIIHQKHGGAPRARNRGFKESIGEYVIFWDADVIAFPEMLFKMYAALQNYPEASYAYSEIKLGWKKINSQSFDEKALRRYNYIDMISLLRRKDFPGFDETLKRLQDWDLWLTLLEQDKKGIFIPEVLKKALVSRTGISNWLPSFLYRGPFTTKARRSYEEARKVIIAKHPRLTFFDL
jgi:glycosyltransferase involved in cell wall biosynthesis